MSTQTAKTRFAAPGGSGAGSSPQVNVQDEGVPVLTPATTLNFIGAGVTATPGAPGVANITIPGGSTENIFYHTVTALELAAKQFTLTTVPATPSQMLVDVIGGGPQEFSVGYTVIINQFNWNGLALDGLIQLNTVIRFRAIP